MQVIARHCKEMDNHSEKSTEFEASEAALPSEGHLVDITSDLRKSELDMSKSSSKVKRGNDTLAFSPSASTSAFSNNFFSSRARTAVWRQKVHSGIGAPVLAGQRILEFPSSSLATHISTVIVPGQRALHQTSRLESSSHLPETLPVAYGSVTPASGVMAVSSNFVSRAPGILPSPGLSPASASLSLHSPGLPLTSAGQRRIPAALSNSTSAAGCITPLMNISRLPSRPFHANGNSLRARSGHMCHSSRQSCSQYCLQGYKFCLWHILEDPSSPYKQCDFVEFPTRDRCCFPVSLKSENTRCVYVVHQSLIQI